MSKNAHTGGVTNKKWKSERKENPIFNRSCGTRLFQHIWSVKFARVRWLSKKAGKTFQLYVPFPDFVDIDLIIRGSHLIVCGRWREKEVVSEAGAAGHLLGFHWVLLLLLCPLAHYRLSGPLCTHLLASE